VDSNHDIRGNPLEPWTLAAWTAADPARPDPGGMRAPISRQGA
jgi:hypothetical protein